MHKLTGAFERQIDEKGRVALPPTLRPRFADGCYLTLGADNTIEVFTIDSFDAESDRMEARQQAGEITRDQLRAFSFQAIAVVPDGQGRISLDARLRTHARLDTKGPVMVCGLLDRLEICSLARYERSMTAGAAHYAEPSQ